MRTYWRTLHIAIIKPSHHVAAYAANEFEVLCVVPDPQVSDNSECLIMIPGGARV